MLVPGDHFGSPFGDQVLPLVLPGVPWSAPRDSRELSGRSLGTLGTFKNLGFSAGKQRISKNHLFDKVQRSVGPHDPKRGPLTFLTQPRTTLGLVGNRGNWVLVGWTGLVLSATQKTAPRLVYRSAALVASLRGQQSHFATLPIIAVQVQQKTMRG